MWKFILGLIASLIALVFGAVVGEKRADKNFQTKLNTKIGDINECKEKLESVDREAVAPTKVESPTDATTRLDRLNQLSKH